ncbi:MAG TPA: NAD(P)/FAD-dependent oxidoreductase [Flavisolibacter sp.]
MGSIPFYDVVVAGAGPAGCASAIVLKQAGLTVCLADGDDGRRIGESFPGATARLLHRLGINGMEELMGTGDYKPCMGNASAWGSDQWTYQDGLSNPEGGGWHVNRRNFNLALRRKAFSAGADLYTGWIDNVETCISDNGEREYLTRFRNAGGLPQGIRSRWLVDATGRKARLSRRFGISRQKMDDQMAAICWFRASANDRDHVTRIKSVREGWWYTALLPEGIRVVSLQSLPTEVAGMIKEPGHFFSAFNAAGVLPYEIDQTEVIDMKAVEAGIVRAGSATADNLVCVGDTALSLDPLSSQGVFFALYSGIKAGEAISRSHTDPSSAKASFEAYQQSVNRVYEANQRSRKYHYSSELRFAGEEYWASIVNRQS